MAGIELPGGVQAPMPVEDTSKEGRIAAEVHAGLRCGGCKERFKQGFRFITAKSFLMPGDLSGRRAIRKEETVACAGVKGCDFAIRVAKEATVMIELSNPWKFLDDPAIRKLIDPQPEPSDG